MEEIETRFGSDVIPFLPNEVSHWQAACESGRVCLRLLQSGGFTKLAGVSYAVVQPKSKRGSRLGGTDVEVLTAVNVGLQEGRWMVRRWMWDSGTDVQRTGRCLQ